MEYAPSEDSDQYDWQSSMLSFASTESDHSSISKYKG